MNNAILPCPFCGGKIETHVALELPDNSFSPLLFCCHHCGAMVSFDDKLANVGRMHGDDSPAIKLWNTRNERTCHVENLDGPLPEEVMEMLEVWLCSECGSPIYNDTTPTYCPYCGAKVVDE